MLTCTYSLVTLLIEQKKARKLLTGIRNQFQECMRGARCEGLQCLETILHRLVRFDASRHRRNIEMYVIPAVRGATRDADSLLAELETLSEAGARSLEQAVERMRRLTDKDSTEIQELCGAMEWYCENLLERLEREERELFPIAQRVISPDGWFRLASQFISHTEEVRRVRLLHIQRRAIESMDMRHAAA